MVCEGILNYIYDETNSNNINSIILFLIDIIKEKVINDDNIIIGIENILEELDDIILDSPDANIYISQIFIELLNNKIINKEKLISIITIKSNNYSNEIIKKLI